MRPVSEQDRDQGGDCEEYYTNSVQDDSLVYEVHVVVPAKQ